MSGDEEPSVFYQDARDGLLTSAADKEIMPSRISIISFRGIASKLESVLWKPRMYPIAVCPGRCPMKLFSRFGINAWAAASLTWENTQERVATPNFPGLVLRLQTDTSHR
ncbi:hypothetical protein IV203_008123 [Nitzschia inconspicua]|uniref:Uncharacterized protein n=1 Tax=Nitzschia inconspicua TaxID=303405 RepID=A0A9K3PLN1_9STRA|nr:hypothetical protein IV203_008123 [Nitzschia inconspicua]